MSQEYITSHGTAAPDELPEIIAAYETACTAAYAVWTDKFSCTRQFGGADLAHLQEVRIFDENRELRVRRKGEVFIWRVIDDAAFQKQLVSEPDAFLRCYKNRVFTETHYLDIAKNVGTDYVATGGGHYTMPEEGLRRVVIRNYLDYDEDGIVKISDFRLVGFEKGE